MKSYFILDCPKQQSISNNLHEFFLEITGKKQLENFWNTLDRQQIKEYFNRPNLEIKEWFKELGLVVRDMSYTMYNEVVQTDVHTDAPPVVAKINFPVLNTKDTYNVWFDQKGNEIDRVECTKPIVLRSDIPHTVETGPNAHFPRIQFSFCFYKEPINLLK